MKPSLFLVLATLAGLGPWNNVEARDPAYQDRHFHHYRLYDYFLQQDAGRREYFGGPSGYIAPSPDYMYEGLKPYYPETIDFILERRPYVPERTVVVPAPPTPRAFADPGFSYYREMRELDLARQLMATRPEAAKRRLLDIIARYPDSRAAAEAAALLRTLP
jgi:hypothetical protein